MATSRAVPPETEDEKADHVIWLHTSYPATEDAKRTKLVDNMDVQAGETVRFTSTEGKVKIHFVDEWPFEGTKHDVGDLEILTLKKGNKARFTCQIKPPGATKWLPPYAGADMKPR